MNTHSKLVSSVVSASILAIIAGSANTKDLPKFPSTILTSMMTTVFVYRKLAKTDIEVSGQD